MRFACLFRAQAFENEIIAANAITVFSFSANVKIIGFASLLQKQQRSAATAQNPRKSNVSRELPES